MTTAYPGYGSQLQYSTAGVRFMNVAQLRKFVALDRSSNWTIQGF